MVRTVHGTNSLWYEYFQWYESSMGRMVHGTNGLHVVRIVNGTNSLVIIERRTENNFKCNIDFGQKTLTFAQLFRHYTIRIICSVSFSLHGRTREM